jgi:YD repeat-containing protein
MGADYTLAYDHNDTTLTTVRAKVDDSLHTANWYGKSSNAGSSLRLTESIHSFGADYRVRRSDLSIGDYRSPSRVDSIVNGFSGLGEKTRVIDPEGDTIVTRYDTAGRPVEIINPDGTRSTIDYLISSPPFIDQDFHGFCMRKRSTDERGVRFEQYYDAFDRLRREISGITADTSKPTRTVKYEYDLLGNLTEVTNPAGQVTAYTYDDFGRVRTKSMADIGTVSYAYDRLGNLRFSQTEEQARRGQMGFTEYDDLNRPTLIGEAVITKSGCATFCEDSLYETAYSCGGSTSGRLTDSIDADVLHIGAGSTSILTASRTLGPPRHNKYKKEITRECYAGCAINRERMGPARWRTREVENGCLGCCRIRLASSSSASSRDRKRILH